MLRIARVQTAFDRGQARVTLEIALEELPRLKGRERDCLLLDARLVASVVAPDLLLEIPSSSVALGSFEAGTIVETMLAHRQVDAAYGYLNGYSDASTFPFGYAGNVIHAIEDDGRRLTLLRHATEAWRTGQEDQFGGLFRNQFVWLFRGRWALLPPDEALGVVREIVREALERTGLQTSFSYGEDFAFTSDGQHTLFEIIHILQQLDPPLAESLVAEHEELAGAVRRFPHGWETMTQESEERAKKIREERSTSGEDCGGFIMCGDGKDREYTMAMMQASKDDNFEAAVEHAMDRYREDTDPENSNQALKAVWPSTCRFRSVLYQAGRQMGPEAEVLLERIPEQDIRMFAEVELAAALAGLPELRGMQSENRPNRGARRAGRIARNAPESGERMAMRSPNGESIRCPKCGWLPATEDRWGCKCGHVWNTFSTGGLCPACQFQWKITVCNECGEISPHSEWYVQE
jgi:hypothetical protein